MIYDAVLHEDLLEESLPAPVSFDEVTEKWVLSVTPEGMLYFISNSGLGTIREDGDEIVDIPETVLQIELEFDPDVLGEWEEEYVADTDADVTGGVLSVIAECIIDIIKEYSTVYVRKHGSSEGSGSIYDPVANIQDGVDLMGDGDVLSVCDDSEIASLDLSGLSGIKLLCTKDVGLSVNTLVVDVAKPCMIKKGNWNIDKIQQVT